MVCHICYFLRKEIFEVFPVYLYLGRSLIQFQKRLLGGVENLRVKGIRTRLGIIDRYRDFYCSLL